MTTTSELLVARVTAALAGPELAGLAEEDRDGRRAALQAWRPAARRVADALLAAGPPAERITQDEMMMRMAEVAALRGTCSRLQVGAAVARGGRVMSTGYNGTPAGMEPCQHDADSSGCTEAVHAEANAIAWAARHGIRTEAADLFVTHQPCRKCAELVVNAGIARVVYRHPYRLTDGVELLIAAGVTVEQLEVVVRPPAATASEG